MKRDASRPAPALPQLLAAAKALGMAGPSTRYRVGRALAPHLDPYASFETIAAELGVTVAAARTETTTALGTLALALLARLQGPSSLPPRAMP
jgi:hypothetical protein